MLLNKKYNGKFNLYVGVMTFDWQYSWEYVPMILAHLLGHTAHELTILVHLNVVSLTIQLWAPTGTEYIVHDDVGSGEGELAIEDGVHYHEGHLKQTDRRQQMWRHHHIAILNISSSATKFSYPHHWIGKNVVIFYCSYKLLCRFIHSLSLHWYI